MFRTLVRQAPGLLIGTALVVAGSVSSYGATVNVPVAATVPIQIIGADSFCTGGWQTGGTASAPTVTCLTGGGGGPTAPSGCSVSATPAGPLAVGGGSTTLSVTCQTGAPTSYSWTANPTPSSGWAGTTSSATQSPTIAATTSFSVTPSNGGGSGNTASTTVSVNVGGGGGGGGGLQCNAVAGSGVSGVTQVLDINWSNPQQARTTNLGINDAAVIRFTTGPNTSGFNLPKISGAEYGSAQSGRTGVLSTNPCDFAVSPSTIQNAVSYGTSAEVNFTVGPNQTFFYPGLSPNTTYYLNVKTDSGGACGPSGNCNMFFQLNKPGQGY